MTDLRVELTFRGIDEAVDSIDMSSGEPLDVDEFVEFWDEMEPATIGVSNVELETETELIHDD